MARRRLAALRARRLSGQGQHAWVAVAEILATVMGGSGLAQYVFLGQTANREGFHRAGCYPWQVVPTRDGFFEFITMVDAHWDRFVELMGSPAWGAEVIKIRAPHRMSGSSMGGRASATEPSDAAADGPRGFHVNDRGKLGITLDLTMPEGVELYLRLVRGADIIVENCAPPSCPVSG